MSKGKVAGKIALETSKLVLSAATGPAGLITLGIFEISAQKARHKETLKRGGKMIDKKVVIETYDEKGTLRERRTETLIETEAKDFRKSEDSVYDEIETAI